MSEMASPYPVGVPCWVDLSTPDVAASLAFYGEVFGWEGEIGPAELAHYTNATVRGRKVAPGVRALVVPGSTQVRQAAIEAGLDKVFIDAGFDVVYARGQSNIPYRNVAPRLINAVLGAFNVVDWVWDRAGLGRRFGTFVITLARRPC